MHTRSLWRIIAPALLALPALAFLACEDSDPVAIEGSNITLSASPNPVDLLLDPQGRSTLIARVETASGVPQEGVTVLFSVTAGQGDVDPRDTTTDDNGEATSTYRSFVETNATVEARSGGVTKSLQISVRTGTPLVHTLNIVGDGDINTCGEVIQLSGQVLGTGNTPIVGAQVTLKIATGSSPEVQGTFGPTNTTTDSNGNYSSSFVLSSQSCTDCTNKSCTILIIGSTPGKDSDPLQIPESL